jgi:ADP-heptose:LPS heptosyltransferase
VKHATVIRLGAIGDAVWTLPVIRELHNDGFTINVHCKQIATPVYKNNPYISKLYAYPNETGALVNISVPHGSNVIDLDNTIEGKYLTNTTPIGCVAHPFRFSLGCTVCLNNKLCRKVNVNYVEEQLRVAGLAGRNPSTLGEIRVLPEDLQKVQNITDNWSNKFVVLWSLATTAHKQYVAWFKLAQDFCRMHADVLVYTMGSPECAIYEQEGLQIHTGHWTLDQSIALISHANLIIGGETGPMNIASCFGIKKLLLLSHSSLENLSKYWTNTSSVQPQSGCHPCYQLHNTLSSCPTKQGQPVCTVDIEYYKLLDTLNYLKGLE